jgi:hypothetical protein
MAWPLFGAPLSALSLRTTHRHHCHARVPAPWSHSALASSILAEGAMTLPVTLSGGVLFAS